MTTDHADSYTEAGETGHHLHELADGAGVEHHRDGEELERTLFHGIVVVAVATSTPPPDA
jgi:hypothetical protein